MNDFPTFIDGLIRDSKAEAEKRAAALAKLSPGERSIRERFERALFGPEPAPELEGLIVHRPEALLAIAQSYMDEARMAGVPVEVGVLPVHSECESVRPILKDNPVQKQDASRYMTAAMLMVGVWMAIRGHAQFVEHFDGPVSLPPVPPLPHNWERNMEQVCRALGTAYEPPEKVTALFG